MSPRPSFLVAVAALGASAFAAPTVESRFNATGDVEGWTTLRINTSTITPIPGAGVPGWDAGHLLTTEVSGGLFTLSAPAAYLGDKSAYFGGSVSYLLSDETSDGGPNLGFFLVKSDLSVALGYAQTLAAGTATPFNVPLRADGNWYRFDGSPVPALATDADLQAALGDLGYMGVNADWTTATNDVTTLDDFALAPVPEPAPLAALALGVVALMRRRVRAKS